MQAVMKLIDYITSQRGLAGSIAKKAGLSLSTVTRISKGERGCTRSTAEAISAASDGNVSVQEVYGFEGGDR